MDNSVLNKTNGINNINGIDDDDDININENKSGCFVQIRHIWHLRSTIALFLVLIAISAVASLCIGRIVEKRCMNVLRETVENGADDARIIFESGERRAQTVAEMLGDHTVLNEETCQKYLDTITTDYIISSFSVLLPDGNMVYPTETEVKMDVVPDYGTESAKELSFVSRYDGITSGDYAMYIVPIKNGGNVRGVLYGYIDLAQLPEYLETSIFNDQSQVYLVDGSTGDFVMDTWHDELGNFNDSSLSDRKEKKGTSLKTFKENLQNDKPDYAVFESKTTGDDFYMCAYPIGKYHLSFQVAVPGSVVFEDMSHIRTIIYILCALQVAALLAYILYFLYRERKKELKNRRRAALNRSITDIQQMLFSVYENPYLAEVSLEAFQNAIGAERVVLLILSNGIIDRFLCLPFISKEEKAAFIGRKLNEGITDGIRNHPDVRSVEFSKDTLDMLQKSNALPALKNLKLENMIASWAKNADGEVIGILYGLNVIDEDESREAAEILANSFYLALQTMESYNRMYRIGNFDAMTGLKNRNAYQRDLESGVYGRMSSLCCIYIDANGLHDINNTYGHACGDAMLKLIGKSIRELFDFEHSYRIGGDEFVVFSAGVDADTIRNRLRAFGSRINARGYFASVGYSFLEKGQSLHMMIENAEMLMYKNKQSFYSASGGKHRITRQRNKELEKFWMTKKEQEDFIGVTSESFLGVYMINIDTDIARTIYKPKISNEILKKTDYHYAQAIREYAERFICAEDVDKFLQIADFAKIAERIENHENPGEVVYRKKDGVTVLMRILALGGYSADNKETLWIFERCSEKNS